MTPEELSEAIQHAVASGFRDDLLAKGQARAMIWRDGVLPEGAPRFPRNLSYDLYSYGYTLLLMALRLREQGGDQLLARSAFEHAGEAIEAVISNGPPDDTERGFHRLLAAVAFHLGRYSARAFSLLNVSLDEQNLSPMEQALARLILRSLDRLDRDVFNWLADQALSDATLVDKLGEAVGGQVAQDKGDTYAETLDDILTDNYLRALSMFIFALETGIFELTQQARAALQEGQSVAGEMNLVPQWWCYRVTIHLIDDLWSSSFHSVLPSGILGGNAQAWADLRELFIATLTKRRRAEVELWPSQTEAATRAVDTDDDLVLSLPTSAGKTRIAELCILRCLAAGKRTVYVTPLRALSAQTEGGLTQTFAPLGRSVTALYGSMGASRFDEDALKSRDIVVATPEKLDFALRNDPSLLDDIGLIVLDEGHMIGLGDREVRYEVQIQRLLKRDDADQRRIVCLSAILPDGEQFDDFVAWLRRDKEGGAVKSKWRPTRLRFGEIIWQGDRAWLNLRVGNERPFVPSFLTASIPPIGRRRRPFPGDQREFVLATAWRLMEEGQTVLIYCPQKNSVEPYAKAIVDLHRRGALTSALRADEDRLNTALAVGREWFGADHPILQCLQIGVAIHHGALPTPYRKEVERLLRDGILTITVSSPTLSQGLNLTATSLVISSLHRAGSIIPAPEFKNVAGRAGRAFVDVEGLVVFPIFDRHAHRQRQWEALIHDAAGRQMESGLVHLVFELLSRLNTALGKPDIGEFTDYIVNNAAAWAFPEMDDESEDDRKTALREWTKHLEYLDGAILGLVGDDEADADQIAVALDRLLASSLWSRRLRRHEEAVQRLFEAALASRARQIWNGSTPIQRKAYYLAGIGWSTGQQLDDIAPQANELLIQANGAILNDDSDDALQSMTRLAELVFQITPFIPDKLPEDWRDILCVWLRGQPLTDLHDENGTDTLKFVEDALVYRLPWAIDAVRVRALAHRDSVGDFMFEDFEAGLAGPALETGTLNKSAAILMQAGFTSRLAAIKAVTDTNAAFSNSRDMTRWLESNEVRRLTSTGGWPTPGTVELWRDFIERQKPPESIVWSRQQISRDVVWDAGIVPPGHEQPLRVQRLETGEYGLYSADYDRLGRLASPLPDDATGMLLGRMEADTQNVVNLTYLGPGQLT
ncbi:hypothetical protein KBTX_03202 [wastewater metagenome]|uniref:Helicase ATP-binding domain-containing protein n=2 Tax=unclassified sequences TaxID=12908 RepID=A0A5B8RE43_9ZZZZ|nr:DEAD/DEAH box helicase [Arhodomonas sp. KWT]QEA06861.1 hypothetical protein KBTEX_03202 [uncultured organism]